MKTRRIARISKVLIVVLLIILSSCSSDDSIQGPPGEDGNANVTSFLFENREIYPIGNQFNISELTQEFIDTGVVNVYVRSSEGTLDFWQPLPLQIEGSTAMWTEIISEGWVMISSDTVGFWDIRIVLVAGNDNETQLINL